MNTAKTKPYRFALLDNPLIVDKYKKMSRERWEGILECKRRFLQESGYDPRTCPHMDPEVAESWVRCRENGLDPNQTAQGRKLEPLELQAVLHKNRLLIEVAQPLFTAFKKMAVLTDYALLLIDNQGVFLLTEGELPVFSLNIKSSVGMLWDEKNAGTTAHTLSIIHNHPILLMGVEDYCRVADPVFVTAAPIYNGNGELIAVLVLAQISIDEPWKESYQKFVSNTLGLMTALSSAIESQVQLRKSFVSLKRANETLEATLALIDEGIITIDNQGIIIYANEEGRRIFNLTPGEVGRKNIQNFLRVDSVLLAMAQRGEAGTVEEVIFLGQSNEQYFINIQPFIDEAIGELNVALLRLNHVSKINALSNNRVGAIAQFTFGDIIGDSAAIRSAIAKGHDYAETDENILLIGESGTGKELFAQAVHNKYCPGGPFIAVNCAALPRELIESELFGYEGGSFTGAARSGRPGKIELAEGGTLFLDEIGDMPFELQAVLLRVLEDKQIMRLGGRRYKKVAFRVIAATNQDLSTMIRKKLFREDLYYRLAVLTLVIPPLRGRNGDAELLANYFIRKYCRKTGRRVPRLSPQVSEIINAYPWPGNVRELENVMVRTVIHTGGDLIEVRDLPEDILFRNDFKAPLEPGSADEKTGKFATLNDIEKNAIAQALAKADGNVVLAACLLGVSKSTMYRRLKEYGIPY